MKATALILGLCLLTVLAPAPVEAHYDTCYVEDLSCILRCETGHIRTPAPHGCYIYGTAAA